MQAGIDACVAHKGAGTMAGLARRLERVNATIPVQLGNGATGETRNLSPGGIFFVTDAEMESGSAIRFTIEFDSPAGKLCLECVGEVVRIERADGKIGVAAKITESRMERRNATPQRQGAHL
jgi:hypothetical protein